MTREFTQEEIDNHLKGLRRQEAQTRPDNRQLEAKLKDSDLIEVKEFEIDGDRFNQYREQVDYENTYPKYYKEFGAPNVWPRKQLEHFISFEVIKPNAGGVYIDVAASASPVTDILKKHFNAAKAYKQDLNYPEGVHDETIGSNANDIPLEDASVDAVLAHNSWEHFEGSSDREFLVEAARILKPGGILCIIPFDLRNEAFQVTSPSVWHNKYKNAPDLPQFDPRAAVVIEDPIKQRLIKYHSPETFLEDIENITDLSFTYWIITNCSDFKFQRHFLTGEKRS